MSRSSMPKNADAKKVGKVSNYPPALTILEQLIQEGLLSAEVVNSDLPEGLDPNLTHTQRVAQSEGKSDELYKWLGGDTPENPVQIFDASTPEAQAEIDSYGVDHSYMERTTPYPPDLYMQVVVHDEYSDVSFYVGETSDALCTYSFQMSPLDLNTIHPRKYDTAGALCSFLNQYSRCYMPRWIAYTDTHVRYVLDRYEKYFEGTQYESTGAFQYLRLNTPPISTPFDFSDAERMPRYFREACVFLRLGNSERLCVEDLPALLLNELSSRKAAYFEAERVQQEALRSRNLGNR